MSERYGRLEKQKARIEARAAVMADVVRGLTCEQSALVKSVHIGVNVAAFGSEALLLLTAQSRQEVLPLLELFPPVGLETVVFRPTGHGIVPTTAHFKAGQVAAREQVLPFLYHVTQTRKKARHTVTWISCLDGRVQVTIECDILNDRAAFQLEHLDDVGHNQVLFRRRPNAWVPDGIHIAARGMEYSPTKDVTASLTVFWPYRLQKFDSLGHEWKALPVYAALALEVSQEAHGNEKA